MIVPECKPRELVSANEIIEELPKLSEAKRRAVQRKLLELSSRSTIKLQSRGINASQAADLRSRLSTFAEDWNRPEMDIYDDDAAR